MIRSEGSVKKHFPVRELNFLTARMKTTYTTDCYSKSLVTVANASGPKFVAASDAVEQSHTYELH